MKLSYAITTHNETEEINELLGFLIHHMDPKDEICILDDYSDEKTQAVFTSWQAQYGHTIDIKIKQRALNGNFAAQKNYLNSMCTGDYIFNLDADEKPHDALMNQLKKILEINDVDLIWIPRVNTVEGLTQEHINKWGWQLSEKGWVNYPDYQARVYRNAEHIKWIKPVHEVIKGANTYSHLPPHEELSLYHHKKIDKQEKQNLFYDDINYIHKERQVIAEPPKTEGNNFSLTVNEYLELRKIAHKDTAYNEYLKGKSVCIVGPSPSLMKMHQGKKIDSFDIVVRTNRGFPTAKHLAEHIGTKTNIHYHSLNMEERCGGAFAWKEMQEEIDFICCPYPKWVGPFYNDVVNFEFVNDGRMNFHCIDTDHYCNVVRKIGTRPTSGIGTIMDLLSHDIGKLYVTGYTFFEDGWYEEYKNEEIIAPDGGLEEYRKNSFNGTHYMEPQKDFVRMLCKADDRFEVDDVMKTI